MPDVVGGMIVGDELQRLGDGFGDVAAADGDGGRGHRRLKSVWPRDRPIASLANFAPGLHKRCGTAGSAGTASGVIVTLWVS